MSFNHVCFSDVLNWLLVIPVSLAPSASTVSLMESAWRKYSPPATAAPAAAAPVINARRLRYFDLGVTSENGISFGFLISMCTFPASRLFILEPTRTLAPGFYRPQSDKPTRIRIHSRYVRRG